MSRDFRFYWDDLIESGEKVLRYSAGYAFEEFVADDKTFDAVVRNLKIVGEAAAKLPAELRTQYPDVPWREIIGFRNVMVHNYFGLDEAIIWRIATSQLEPLKEQAENILALESEED
jgi:uncharacterized protein with HEPN domain